MKITPEIISALEKSIEHHGNVTQFAKSLGIAHSTVLFWLSGKTTDINGRIWAQKIRPSILPFMELDSAANDSCILNEPRGNYVPAKDSGEQAVRKAIHVVPKEKIGELDITIEPVQEFTARMNSKKTFVFASPLKPSYFAVEYETLCLPFKLAMLIASGEYPKDNDIILAKIRATNRIITGRFSKSEDTLTITLLLSPNNEVMTWNFREHPGYLCWLFPIVEIQSDVKGELE